MININIKMKIIIPHWMFDIMCIWVDKKMINTLEPKKWKYNKEFKD
jgi:hypothetical protein